MHSPRFVASVHPICYRYDVTSAEARNPGDAAMDRYARGDRSAFVEVYETVVPRVFPYLRRQTGSTELAEDLLQQMLLQMHRGCGTFVPGSAVVPWAFAIARRVLIDERRRGKRRVPVVASDLATQVVATPAHSGPDGFAIAKELAGEFQAVFEALPSSQREAFELLRIDGLSHAEAAEVLGITVSALKFRAYRASLALRSAMSGRAESGADG